jgi:hypothetical protein
MVRSMCARRRPTSRTAICAGTPGPSLLSPSPRRLTEGSRSRPRPSSSGVVSKRRSSELPSGTWGRSGADSAPLPRQTTLWFAWRRGTCGRGVSPTHRRRGAGHGRSPRPELPFAAPGRVDMPIWRVVGTRPSGLLRLRYVVCTRCRPIIQRQHFASFGGAWEP